MADEPDRRLTLTKSQAACLMVLRSPGLSAGRIAVAAKLDLYNVATALMRLEELGLAKKSDSRRWLVTEQGETCSFRTARDRRAKRGRPPAQLMLDFDEAVDGLALVRPGSSGQRLIDLLDRPTHGRTLPPKLGVSRERFRQLLLSLHARGRIVFGDPDQPSWLIKRADDESPILSREAERVLSALPGDHPTDGSRLRIAARVSEDEVERSLADLVAAGLAEALPGLWGGRAFRITAAGLDHPQYVPPRRAAPAPPLPVRSVRIRTVLQTLSDAGALRTRDVKILTKIPQNSINALMQYLKRRELVAKAGPEFDAPYSLTQAGRAVLAEMTLRYAA